MRKYDVAMHAVHASSSRSSVVREDLPRRRLIGSEARGDRLLWCFQSREVEPGERVLEVAPDPLHRVQLWTLGRQEHETHVRREDRPLGGVRRTVVQEQEVWTVWDGPCEGVDEELEALGVRYGHFRKSRSSVAGSIVP
jgi:hypothetical protein